MALDPRFIITSDIDTYYVDKDTGLPLSAGIVTFYSDINRTIKKPVYQITGSPPNYTYSVLPNPCILSDVGTFQDAMQNNIVPYYFPYEGTPSSSSGSIELYYITVESSGLVNQLTREGWPNFTASDVSNGGDLINFIPNGQFLAHNSQIATSGSPVNTINNVDILPIAQGGWSFQRTHGGTSTFANSFSTISSGISGLKDFPRFAFNFQCTLFNSNDAIRDLNIGWPNVNTFSSGNPVGDQDYTFFFAGESNDSNTYTFDVILIYYFGTGGSPSPTISTVLGSVQFSPSYSYFTISIPGFPANAGTIGTNNDDSVSISLRGPNATFNIQVTDFGLALGNISFSFFPIQPNAQTLSQGVAGWMPTPAADGSDLYLPLVLTPRGMTFDHSQVGKIYASTSTTLDIGELACDGTQYLSSGYSSVGIPYSRIQAKIANYGCGTGLSFVTSSIGGAGLYFYQNKFGTSGSYAVPAAANSGFTMTVVSLATATGYLVGSFRSGSQQFIIRNLTAGLVSASSVGTTSFTLGNNANNTSIHAFTFFNVAGVVSSLAGEYFTFNVEPGNAAYYVWYRFNASGADPAPGGTGIRIDLVTGDTFADVTDKTVKTLKGGYGYNISTTSGAAITAGHYWTFGVPNSAYYVWYTVDGVGTDPAPGGTGIKVAVLSGDSASQVATKTSAVINGFYFAVPNLQGMFLRGFDPNSIWDDNSAMRFFLNESDTWGDLNGSSELDSLQSHSHTYRGLFDKTADGETGGASLFSDDTLSNSSTNLSGGEETRPVNTFVNWVIKY